MPTTIFKQASQTSSKRIMAIIAMGVSLILLGVSPVFAQTCNPNISPSTPTARFTPQGDGTVLDNQTNLIWQRCLAGQTWHSANTSCNGTAGAYTWRQALNLPQGDWRVPNIKELSSIVEISCYSPAINLTVFPGDSAAGVWSSSPDYSNRVWFIYFSNGYDYSYHKGYVLQVRLVRSGQ